MRSKALFKKLDRLIGVPLAWLLGLFVRPRGAPQLKPGMRVLVVKFSAMGDTLLLLPLLKALREAVGSEGHLEMIGTPVNQAVMKQAPWLDRCEVVEPGKPWQLFGLLGRLRQRRFDVAIDFDQWLRISALLSFGSGATLRFGFEAPGQAKHFLFHGSLPNRKDVHEFSQFCELAALAGLAGSVEPYAGFLKREGFLGARELPHALPKLVVLHPGTGGKQGWQREWPVEYFSELSQWLRREMKVRVAVSGAGDYEGALCAQIPSDEACVDNGLRSLVDTLCRADLLICGNTGVMHLAAGLGTPVLALHGPNPHLKWGPLGEKARVLLAHVACSPCLSLGFEFGCPLRPCMESISVDETRSAAAEMLA